MLTYEHMSCIHCGWQIGSKGEVVVDLEKKRRRKSLTGRSCRGGPARLVNHSWWRCIGREQGRVTEHSDLTLVMCPVITRREGAGWLRNQTLERSCDRTHRGAVWTRHRGTSSRC
jgi:hypothetical protein